LHGKEGLSEQIDIAVDLGVVPAGLPEIEFFGEFVAHVAGDAAAAYRGDFVSRVQDGAGRDKRSGVVGAAVH
jgi:hypothetical protein